MKGTVSQKDMDEIDIVAVCSKGRGTALDAVGFLVLRLRGDSPPLAGANIDLMGVRDAKGNELMYFEIPMEKYLSAPTNSRHRRPARRRRLSACAL